MACALDGPASSISLAAQFDVSGVLAGVAESHAIIARRYSKKFLVF